MIALTAPHSVSHRQPSNRGIAVFVLASLIIHAMIVWLFSRGGISLPVETQQSIEPIQARIIYPELPKVEVELPIVEQPVEAAPEAIENDVIEDEVIASEAIESEPVPTTQPEVSHPIDAEEIEQAELATELPVEESNQPPSTTLNSSGTSTMSLTERYLNRYHQQQMQSQSEMASEEYRRSINSPDLDIPTMAEIAEEPGPKTQTVACDDTAANVLRIMSQLVGGTLRCRDKPDIDEFIQKRLDKEQ